MKTFKQYLGPQATKQHDKEEISRQKTHLSNKAKEYYAQSAREGGGGAAKAKGDSFAAAKENIHSEEFKIGDKVKPNTGPHAGEEHEVIHVHADGRVNIKPTKSTHVKYHLGAAMAQPHQLTLSEMDSQGYKGTRDDGNPWAAGGKATPVKVKDVVKKGTSVLDKAMKKAHPKTWHDVDPNLGKQVDKMSQAEKVKKGLAHPDTLKKKVVKEDGGAMGVAAVAGTGDASLPQTQREPGVSKKRNPVLKGILTRKPPKV
jgi:hypothetical protein